MISAKQAKELYDQSGAEVEKFLKHNVEQKIKDAAGSGKRHVFICQGSIVSYSHPTMTPLEKGVMDALTELGYKVSFTKHTDHTYVPRGLADDNGNGPEHQNYGFNIGW